MNVNGQVLDPVSSGVAVSNPASTQSSPAVASDGTNFFVVWQDNRLGPLNIYGTRMSAGVSQDGSGFLISSEPDSDQTQPAVAYNGTYLVAWRDQTRDPGISAARVDPNGHVLDTYFPVASNADAQAPSVSNGASNQWAVTYQQGTVASTSIEMNRVSPK